MDTPTPVLLAQLAPLKAFKGVKGFDAINKGGGKYKIVMYGSEHDVKDPYTTNPDGNEKSEHNKNEPAKEKDLEGDNKNDNLEKDSPLDKTGVSAKEVNKPVGNLEFDEFETTAANRLGFFPEEVTITNGVADVPIIYMSEVKPRDITSVSNALRANGATSIRVNSGPIINDTISNRLQNAYDAGKNFLGFKIIKTGNPDNMFILVKKL